MELKPVNDLHCYFTEECDVEPGDLVVDIGAYIGQFCQYAAEKGAERIFAFEPGVLQCVEILKLRIPTVVLAKAAVVKEAGNCVYYFRVNDPPGSTIYDSTAGPGEYVTGIAFEAILDKLPRVDFLKIDCEGPERDFLPGSDLSKVKKLAVEWHTDTTEQEKDFWRFLNQSIDPFFERVITFSHADRMIFTAWRKP